MAAANKTAPTAAAVEAHFAAQPEARAADCRALATLMQRVSGHSPRMWGRMVGLGHHHDVHDSGREGDISGIGFASGAGSKGDISLYLSLGCLYIKRLSDIDLGGLEALCGAALKERRA